MDKFKFLENITDADYAFEAYGKNLAELFENCALALTSLMVELSTVEPKVKRELLFRGEQPGINLFQRRRSIILLPISNHGKKSCR
jgi:SHS2 domain-containing protein